MDGSLNGSEVGEGFLADAHMADVNGGLIVFGDLILHGRDDLFELDIMVLPDKSPVRNEVFIDELS